MKPSGQKPPQNQPESTYSTRAIRFSSIKSALVGTQPARPKNPLPRWGWRRVGLVLLCLAVGVGGGILGGYIEYQHAKAHPSVSTQKQVISSESSLISQIAKDVGASVVSINVESQTTTPDVFGFSQTQQQTAAGTGFIISSNGLIVTNRHVVPDGTTSVSVTLSDGTTFNNVQVVGRSSSTSPQDIAFLKITNLNGKTLTPVTLGDSAQMQVGSRVVAIGNALGQFQNTVTTGIISGYGRSVTAGDATGSSENLTDLFQTDAAINEGNSGGPLVNMNGEVIGVNTAVASNAQNIGFAQPINDVKGLINSVLANGKLQQPYLGVRYISLTNDIAYEFNLKVNRGAYVISTDNNPAVVPGSPAAAAGIKEKDIITKIDNTTINDTNTLTAVISRHKVGDRVTITIVRDGKTLTVHATLSNEPS